MANACSAQGIYLRDDYLSWRDFHGGDRWSLLSNDESLLLFEVISVRRSLAPTAPCCHTFIIIVVTFFFSRKGEMSSSQTHTGVWRTIREKEMRRSFGWAYIHQLVLVRPPTQFAEETILTWATSSLLVPWFPIGSEQLDAFFAVDYYTKSRGKQREKWRTFFCWNRRELNEPETSLYQTIPPSEFHSSLEQELSVGMTPFSIPIPQLFDIKTSICTSVASAAAWLSRRRHNNRSFCYSLNWNDEISARHTIPLHNPLTITWHYRQRGRVGYQP